MRRARRVALWASAAVAIALLFLLAGQVNSATRPLQVFRVNVHGLAIGDYRGSEQALAPLSPQVIDDANRDAMTTPSVSSAAIPEPASVDASPAAPSAQAPVIPTPTPAATPLVLATAASIGSITGAVQDSQTSVGIANALVSLTPTGLSTVSGSNGAFGFASVAAGTYTVTVSATGYQTGSTSVTVTAGHNANINLHLVSTVPSGSVQGVVKSLVTGKAVAGAALTLTPGALTTVTDSTGYYGFPSVTPGTYTLTVTAAGYLSYSQTITVASGHTVKANVSLTPL